MSDIQIKALLLLTGLIIGFFVFRYEEKWKNILSTLVFNWLLPYIVFVEVASIELAGYWWNDVLIGALFVLIPFFVGWRILRLSKSTSVLVATAEGGTVGFLVYATIGSEPLVQFFLIDMIGNGLSVFLIVFPILAHGSIEKNATFMRLVGAMILGMTSNFVGIHPLQAVAFMQSLEPWLVLLLILSISTVVGSGIVFMRSMAIYASKVFLGFWVYRVLLLCVCIYLQLPLAVIVLATLPPSFMIPIFHQIHKKIEDAEYATNFIACCIPISAILISGLIVFW